MVRAFCMNPKVGGSSPSGRDIFCLKNWHFHNGSVACRLLRMKTSTSHTRTLDKWPTNTIHGTKTKVLNSLAHGHAVVWLKQFYKAIQSLASWETWFSSLTTLMAGNRKRWLVIAKKQSCAFMIWGNSDRLWHWMIQYSKWITQTSPCDMVFTPEKWCA